MKKIFALVLLASMSSFAALKIGNSATYKLTTKMNSDVMTGTLLTEIVQYDAAAKVYTLRDTVVFDQKPETQERQASEDSLLNDEKVSMVLANCEASKGKKEQLSTSAGVFDTCAMPFDNEEGSGTVWIGPVTFGVVKAVDVEKANGVQNEMVLESFK